MKEEHKTRSSCLKNPSSKKANNLEGDRSQDEEADTTANQAPQDLRKVPVLCLRLRPSVQYSKKMSPTYDDDEDDDDDDDTTKDDVERPVSPDLRPKKRGKDKVPEVDSKGAEKAVGDSSQTEEAKGTSSVTASEPQEDTPRYSRRKTRAAALQAAALQAASLQDAEPDEEEKKSSRGRSQPASRKKKLLECRDCGKPFRFRSHLVIHERTHTGERLFVCDVCGKRFITKTHLVRHQFSHTGEKPYICSVCTKCFASRYSLAAHQKRHTAERPPLCLVRGKTYISSTGLTIHKRMITDCVSGSQNSKMDYNLSTSKSHCVVAEKYSLYSKEDRDFITTTEQSNVLTMKEEYKSQSSCFQPHLSTQANNPDVGLHSDDEADFATDEAPQDLRKVPLFSLNPHTRVQDPKELSQINNDNVDDATRQDVRKFSLVLRPHQNFPDKFPESNSSKGGDKVGSGTSQTEQAKCANLHHPLTHQKHDRKGVPKKHKPQATSLQAAESEQNKGSRAPSRLPAKEKKPLQCNECGKHFTYQSHLIVHQQTHTGERLYGCEECGKTFLTRAHLLRHQVTHTDERPYICSLCRKGFTSSYSLALHHKTHTGEKSHLCLVCGKTFISSTALTIHERTHTGEKPYTCHDCGKSFTFRPSLIIHQRSHTGERPYECTECGKKFACSSNLLVHHRTHTGERPYSCEECGVSFARSAHLIRHRHTHVGGGPYICSECGTSFESMSRLARHKKLHAKQ